MGYSNDSGAGQNMNSELKSVVNQLERLSSQAKLEFRSGSHRGSAPWLPGCPKGLTNLVHVKAACSLDVRLGSWVISAMNDLEILFWPTQTKIFINMPCYRKSPCIPQFRAPKPSRSRR